MRPTLNILVRDKQLFILQVLQIMEKVFMTGWSLLKKEFSLEMHGNF